MGELTKGRAAVRWDSVVEKVWKDLGGEQFGGYKAEVKDVTQESERLALRKKVKEEKNYETYRGLREDIGMKTYMHGPMDYSKKLKLRFRVGDLDLPERRKRYTWYQ